MASQTKRIQVLTPEQERAMLEYRALWLAIGRSCEPADREASESVFRAMYDELGEAAPYIWWCDGPAVGTLVRASLWANLRTNLWTNLRDNLWDNLMNNLRNNLWDNIGAPLWANLWTNLWTNLRANLGHNLEDNLRSHLGANLEDSLRSHLGANLRDNLRDDLRAHLRANLRDNLEDNLRSHLGASLGAHLWHNLRDDLGDNLGDNFWWDFWGQHEAAWPAFYAWPDIALRSMHNAEQRARLGWWLTLARSCGWWQPYRGIVFACERPERQAVDALGRLHHESVAALKCRDGWSVYAWHGVRVPAHVIEAPQTLTMAQIGAETNAEVRRVMIERFGWDRWLHTQGAHPIHSDQYGELYRTELDGASIGVVIVRNSTAGPTGEYKRYALLVPPEHETAHSAVASTFGLTDGQYAPQVET